MNCADSQRVELILLPADEETRSILEGAGFRPETGGPAPDPEYPMVLCRLPEMPEKIPSFALWFRAWKFRLEEDALYLDLEPDGKCTYDLLETWQKKLKCSRWSYTVLLKRGDWIAALPSKAWLRRVLNEEVPLERLKFEARTRELVRDQTETI